MASITKRRDRYCVVYLCDDENGKRKQKWETFKTLDEAKRRKAEIEYRQELGKLIIPQCRTLDDLLKEYVSLYGKNVWSISMYDSSTALIRHYISPIIGSMKITDITPRILEKYYQQLLKTKAVSRCTDRNYEKKDRYVTAGTVKKIHNLLRSCFNQALKWELIEKNPATLATVPKAESKERDIWDAETLFRAVEACEDDRLELAINMAFACSLRLGELLGLTWDCVDISEESIQEGRPSIFVKKELQRVRKDTMDKLSKKDIIKIFPEVKVNNSTVLVLKKPKTETSIRKIFLPRTVAQMMIDWKAGQDATKEALGEEYHDYDLVIAGPFGHPMESSRINEMFKELIEKNDLPKVVFHSLRHSSITYKLKLNGGDVKAVQGDSGHAQAKMVTDQYSHILDEDRRTNAQLFEDAFYGRRGAGTLKKEEPAEDESAADAGGIDPATLARILTNPEMASLLKALAKSIS